MGTPILVEVSSLNHFFESTRSPLARRLALSARAPERGDTGQLGRLGYGMAAIPQRTWLALAVLATSLGGPAVVHAQLFTPNAGVMVDAKGVLLTVTHATRSGADASQ